MKYVKESNPLFSIAIPTYNRVDSLREIVDCYINQDFKDFEIIIANDYIEGTELSEGDKIIARQKVVGNINTASKRRYAELRKLNPKIKLQDVKKALRIRNISDIKRKNSPYLGIEIR